MFKIFRLVISQAGKIFPHSFLQLKPHPDAARILFPNKTQTTNAQNDKHDRHFQTFTIASKPYLD